MTPVSEPTPHLTGDEAAAVLDPARLAEIVRLGLHDAARDPVADAAARAAAEALGLPVGLVTVVMDDAQGFVGAHGVPDWLAEAGGTPIEWSFCRFAVADGGPFVVEDAATHPRVRENPLVLVDGVRCYAGVPLVTSAGAALGALCVLGAAPRTFDDDALARLAELAAELAPHLERRAAGRG